jgi:hypothetical protein
MALVLVCLSLTPFLGRYWGYRCVSSERQGEVLLKCYSVWVMAHQPSHTIWVVEERGVPLDRSGFYFLAKFSITASLVAQEGWVILLGSLPGWGRAWFSEAPGRCARSCSSVAASLVKSRQLRV